MNLILAIIVEGAIDSSAAEKLIEKKIKLAAFRQMIPDIKAIFAKLDRDNSGTLSVSEIQNVPEDAKKAIFQVAQTDDVEAIYYIVDEDGSGKVDIDEFVHSLEHFVTSGVPLETFRTMRDVIITRQEVEDLKMTFDERMRGIDMNAGFFSKHAKDNDNADEGFPDFMSFKSA